jgi:hypothetical protein
MVDSYSDYQEEENVEENPSDPYTIICASLHRMSFDDNHFAHAQQRILHKAELVRRQMSNESLGREISQRAKILVALRDDYLADFDESIGDDFFELARTITTRIFHRSIQHVWQSMGVRTGSGDRYLIQNFINYCKIKETNPEECERIIGFPQVMYDRSWNNNLVPRVDSTSLDKQWFLAALNSKKAKSMHVYYVLYMSSILIELRNQNEHMSGYIGEDLISGHEEQGSYVASFSLWVLSLYAYDQLLDLIIKYA